jgi:multiple antibiotic resistance protein
MSADFGLADIFMILLITVGPLKAAVVYAKLTGQSDRAFQRAVAFKTVTIATIVTIIFVFFGQFLLSLFHVSLPALKIAGGLILLLFALDMVIGGGHGGHEGAPVAPTPDIAIYPLAMPLMATPQGLVAITTIVAETTTFGQKIGVAVIILVIMAINLAILLSAGKLLREGAAGTMVVISKVVGILLAALAIQLMISAGKDLGLLAATVGVGTH